jgi:glucosamine 6-phosphate synthetase-like amidotransferase/phosphosugar isomerase protein
MRATAPAIEEAAELMYLAPSVHLLATRLTALAREGALKIREVVLNHAEGFEGSEFKHGPNTILGFNTLIEPRALDALLREPSPRLDGPSLRRLSVDYPLLYLTGPDERDVALTVSQINTHKIRGSSSIVIAEEHPALRAAAEKPPADNPGYRHVYVALPPTGDTLSTVFTATVALQRLALRMSLLKMAWLDRLGVVDHGVHPDVPKNVSKSITVD